MTEGEKRLLLAAAMGWILPALLLVLWRPEENSRQKEEYSVPTTEARQETESLSREPKILVMGEDGTIREMELENYVTGVVAAEMPPSFEPEALKAQAVVARTYTLRRSEVSRKHEQYDVCENASCCQGYMDSGCFDKADWEKIQRAVQDTAGQVLTFEGDLAEATYFSCSGGSTEDAAAVWGSDVPYLRATDSPGESEDYRAVRFFSREELEALLGVSLLGDPESWLQNITYTDGGGVDTVEICGQAFRGTELRKRLGLNSTCFSATPMAEGLTISTVGFGHRVGMSQYGADAMAVEGADYLEILSHYYQGTQVENWETIMNFS